jgi:hypothetical protein
MEKFGNSLSSLPRLQKELISPTEKKLMGLNFIHNQEIKGIILDQD